MNRLRPLLEVLSPTDVKATTPRGWDFGVHLERGRGGSLQLVVEERSGVVGRRVVERFLARALTSDQVPILVAGKIPRSSRERIRDAGRGYLDDAGNLYLRAGSVLVHVDGRTSPPKPPREVGLRTAGMRVLGAYLADAALLSASLREVAGACGVSTKAVRAVRARLADQGQLITDGGRRALADPEALLDGWLFGYRELIRPKISAGRFHLPHDDPSVLARILNQLDVEWAWGGSQGAFRGSGTTPGTDLVVHLPDMQRPQVPSFLRPSERGRLEVLGIPARAMWSSSEATNAVHPLLCLAELAWRHDPRSREIAADVREDQQEIGR